MKIDVTKSAIENLIAQIKSDNPSSTISAAQFTAGVPADVDIGLGRGNTDLIITGVPGAGKSGTKTLSYTRLTVVQGTVAPTTELEVIGNDDEATVVAKLIATMGLVASEVETTNYIAPTDAETDGLITIGGKLGSLLYVTNTFDIVLKLSDISLEDDIPNGVLGGFEPA
jgi:hypothetical protein